MASGKSLKKQEEPVIIRLGELLFPLTTLDCCPKKASWSETSWEPFYANFQLNWTEDEAMQQIDLNIMLAYNIKLHSW